MVVLIIFSIIISQCLIFEKVNIAVLLSNHFGLTFCVISDNLTKSYTYEKILFFHDPLGSVDCWLVLYDIQ